MRTLLNWPAKFIHRLQKLANLYHKGQYWAFVSSIVTSLPFFSIGCELLAVAFYDGHRTKFMLLLLSRLLGKRVNRQLKKWLAQPRPAGSQSKSNGMPSYHAQAAFFVLTVLPSFRNTFLCQANAQIVTFLLASWVALTRIHLGQHTSIQVAVGALVGVLLGLVFDFVVLEVLKL